MVAIKEPKRRALRVLATGEGNVVSTEPILLRDPVGEFMAREEAERRQALAALLERMSCERVALRDLRNVDVEHYQRGATRRIVQSVVGQFNWGAIGVPLVSRRDDGTYWVIDGQNRVLGLRELLGSTQHIWCGVLTGLSIPEEASIFQVLNGSRWRSNVSGLQEWKAAETAGDAMTLAVKAVLAELGLSVGPGRGPRLINAPSGPKWIYRLAGAPALREVAELALRAWGGEPEVYDALKAGPMRGLFTFLRRYRNHPHFNRLALVERLSSSTPRRITVLARQIVVDAHGGLFGDPNTCFARAVLAAYNTREQTRAGKPLPGWFEEADWTLGWDARLRQPVGGTA